MKLNRFAVAAVVAVLAAAPAAARINMLEPWSPGLDTRIPKDVWNHDAHIRMGFGQHNRDLFELGYILTTTLSPDWEVGGGLNFLSVDGPMGGSESGFGDIPVGAKYRLPSGYLPQSMDAIGEAGITLPTGDADKGLGAGGLGLFFGGSLQGALAEDVTGFAHLGFRYYSKGQDTDLGEVIEYTFGGKYRITGEWIATADVRGFNHSGDEYRGVKGEGYNEIYLSPGAVYRPGRSHVEYLGNVLLGLTDDSYDFGMQFSAKF